MTFGSKCDKPSVQMLTALVHCCYSRHSHWDVKVRAVAPKNPLTNIHGVFESRERKLTVFVAQLTQEGILTFSLFWLSFATFCDFVTDIVQKLRTFLVRSTNFFSCAGWMRAIPSGQGGPLLPAWVAIRNTGFASSYTHCQPYNKVNKICNDKYILSHIMITDLDTMPFSTQIKSNSWATVFNKWWSVDGPMNHSFFYLSPLRRVHRLPTRNIGKTYIPQSILSLYFVFCLHSFSSPWGEKINW